MSEVEQYPEDQELAGQAGEPEGAPATAGVAGGTDPSGDQDPLVAAQQEALMWKDVALRAKAELENFRKRMARERADAARYANADLLHALLPVLDNFEFGLQAAKAEEGSSIYLGMKMVLKQIQDFLGEQGVELIDAVGQPFDPNLHDAVAQEASADVPEGHVVTQVRPGYRLYDRLLRPAGVHVSTGALAQESGANTGGGNGNA